MYDLPSSNVGRTVVLGTSTGAVLLPATGDEFRNILALTVATVCGLIIVGFVTAKLIVRFSKS